MIPLHGLITDKNRTQDVELGACGRKVTTQLANSCTRQPINFIINKQLMLVSKPTIRRILLKTTYCKRNLNKFSRHLFLNVK